MTSVDMRGEEMLKQSTIGICHHLVRTRGASFNNSATSYFG